MDIGIRGNIQSKGLTDSRIDPYSVFGKEDDAVKKFGKESENIVRSPWRDEISDHKLENVVAMSSDGDTLQVKRTFFGKGSEQNGSVVDKTDVEKRSEEPAKSGGDLEINAEKSSEDMPRKITSFAGYTLQQIEQLYRQGQISRQQYEKQLELKKTQTEEMRSGDKERIEELSRLSREYTGTKMDSEAVATAFSKDSNSNAKVSAGDRLEIMENLKKTNDFDRLSKNGGVGN